MSIKPFTYIEALSECENYKLSLSFGMGFYLTHIHNDNISVAIDDIQAEVFISTVLASRREHKME